MKKKKKKFCCLLLLLLKPQNLKFHSSKGKASSGKRRGDKTSSVHTAKQLQRQATQLDKITYYFIKKKDKT